MDLSEALRGSSTCISTHLGFAPNDISTSKPSELYLKMNLARDSLARRSVECDEGMCDGIKSINGDIT